MLIVSHSFTDISRTVYVYATSAMRVLIILYFNSVGLYSRKCRAAD